jgi:hypothetical protein
MHSKDMSVWFRCAEPDWPQPEPWRKKWMDIDRGRNDDDEDFCAVVY